MCKRFICVLISVGLIALVGLSIMTFKLDMKHYKLTKKNVLYYQNNVINNDNNPIELVPTNHDFSMFISTRDGCVSSIIRSTGTWEQEIVDTLKRFVHPDSIVLHLGAHIGFDDILLGKLVGNNGKVYSFEANPESYDISRKNIIINNLENNVTLYPLGVGDKESDNTSAPLCFNYDNTGGAFVDSHADAKYSKCSEIKLVALDSILKEVPRIDVLFMDIEGYEIKAMSGGENLLKRSPNAVIIAEWNNKYFQRAGSDQAQFLKTYHEAGYRFFDIVQSYNHSSVNYQYIEMDIAELLDHKVDGINILILPKGFTIEENLQKLFRFK